MSGRDARFLLCLFSGMSLVSIGLVVMWVGRSLPPSPVGVGLFLIAGGIGWFVAARRYGP